MDTTPEYIEMCKKATEIQNEWDPQAWDYLFCLSAKFPKFSTGTKTEGKIAVLSEYDTDFGFSGHGLEEANGMVYLCDSLPNQPFPLIAFKKYHLFLPRQDQLQDMMNLNINDSTLMISDFLYRADEKGTIISQYDSWEKIWLAFVMKECYNKVWQPSTKTWEKAN